MGQRLNSHLSSFVFCPEIPKKDKKPDCGSGVLLSNVSILDTQDRYCERSKGYIIPGKQNMANVSQ